MKCPNCGYIHGYRVESTETSFKREFVEGEHGDFYSLPIKLERSGDYYVDTGSVYGCPACKIVFFEE